MYYTIRVMKNQQGIVFETERHHDLTAVEAVFNILDGKFRAHEGYYMHLLQWTPHREPDDPWTVCIKGKIIRYSEGA